MEELRQAGYPLDYMLRWIKMARSVFYYHVKHLDDGCRYSNEMLRIKQLYDKNKGSYGHRRIYFALRNEGFRINHKVVQKLMHMLNLKAKTTKRHYRSYKGEVGKTAPNILERNFKADKPNQKWATDVTQVCIHDVKMYLSPILDMYNGEIITYTISRSPNLKMATDMLKLAFEKFDNLNGLILHSDQVWHYQHGLYRTLLKKHGIIQSMSRKGNCLDNSMMENFFGLMKNELLYVNDFNSVEEFEIELRKYIEWYNNDRIKLRLNGKSPV